MSMQIKSMARRSWPVALLILTLVVAACAEEETAGRSADDPIRIALVAPSASNDLAFTQSMVESLNRLAADYEITVDTTDGTFVIEDAAVAIRGYADDGFDIVIAHGSQYGGSLAEIAPDFPDTVFAWGTTRDTFGLPNVYAYTVESDQGGYLNGVIAARLTESQGHRRRGPDRSGRRQALRRRFCGRRQGRGPVGDGERQLHRLISVMWRWRPKPPRPTSRRAPTS